MLRNLKVSRNLYSLVCSNLSHIEFTYDKAMCNKVSRNILLYSDKLKTTKIYQKSLFIKKI